MAFSLPAMPLRLTDANGRVVTGALMHVYLAGTTTDAPSYTTAALDVAHPNPVVANSSGLFPAVFLPPGDYKFVWATSADVEVAQLDNFTVEASGSEINFPVTSKNANFNVLSSDRANVFLVDTSAGSVTVSADSATLGNGFPFYIVKTAAANTVTFQGVSAQTIDGAASTTISAQYSSLGVVSLGATGWQSVMSSNTGTFAASASFLSTSTFTGTATFNGAVVSTKAVSYTPVTLTDQASIALDVSTGTNFQVTLGGNRTLAAFSGGTVGQRGTLRVIQDATGGRTLDLSNAVYDFSGGKIEPISTEANAVTEYEFEVIAADTAMRLKRKWMSGRSSIGFYKEYDMGTYAISTAYTQAHGFAVRPSLFLSWLECTTTNAGFAVGDRILVAVGGTNAAGNTYMTFGYNATDVFVSTGNTVSVANNKSTGATVSLTAGSWKIIFVVYE